MKKIIIVVSILLSLIFSTACSSVKNVIQTGEQTNTGLSTPDEARDVFFSFEDFKKASQEEKSNQYFHAKDKNKMAESPSSTASMLRQSPIM